MAESRKTVTIVFADVSGSTALGERLDPEAMRRVMERYFAEMRAVLERHGGTVEKFIGDAVMAVFGIPTVHEDDALRAVRAAAEMREGLATLNEELGRERGVELAVRTGVNTGEVVAGDAGEGQAFATGDAVNVAARLEQAAEPGEILLGELTRRLVREAVHAEPVEPLALKGKTDAVTAWRLLDVLADVPAFTRRIEAPFVGRSQELAALRALYERARDAGTPELVTVVAPAGLGKSRLARELVASVAHEARVVVGRCLPYGEGITYWPLAEIVRQVVDDDSHESLLSLFRNEEDGGVVAAHLSAAVGVIDAPSRTEEIAWAARRFFETLARERPLVVVCDDIHWAEGTLLDLLEYVANFAAARIVLLCLARPDLFESRTSWSLPRPRSTTVALAPLDTLRSEELVEALASRADAHADLRRRIVERAEGNPLFVEQMLAHARDDRNGLVEVPPTIQALLAARIDALEPAERAVVEAGAVEGRLFHRGAVSALLADKEWAGVTGELMSLVRKEFIRPDRAALPGDDGFRFAHILVRDAAYASTGKERRADLHERYAAWLVDRAGERFAELAEIVGFHLEQAHRYWAEVGHSDERTAELARRAGTYLMDAGRRAFRRGDFRATTNLLGRAADLGVELPGEAAVYLIDARLGLGDFTGAERDVTELAKRGGLSERLYAEIYRSHVETQLAPEGASERALERGQAAVQGFARLGDDAGLARTWVLIGTVHMARGELTRAREAAEKARRHAAKAGDRRQEAESFKLAAATMFWGGAPFSVVLSVLEEQLEWARAHNDLGTEAEVIVAIAVARAVGGEFAVARKLAAEGEELLRTLGGEVHLASFNGSGEIAFLAGDYAEAERRYRSAYGMLEAAGERGFLSTVACILAEVLVERGRPEEAWRYVERGRELGASDDVVTQYAWRSAGARVLAAEGRFSEALELARQAVAVIETTEYLDNYGAALFTLGVVAVAAGRHEEAADALERAVAAWERKENIALAARARERLAEVQSAVGSPSQ
jgi:class 3 adenylate cyclase/tetratricopeptide (TPR) repeat protein